MLSFAVGAAFAAAAPQLLANPSGGSVAAGSASFSASGNTFTITNSPGAIINWQQFSIAKDEITRFIQQNAASSVLNRVVSQNPSLLLGTLQSNGRVFLINPSGITFGAGAVIDVAGFAASTLNMSDADFISGRMRFVGNGSEGGITNAGTIRTAEGGHVYLIAPNVENQASAVITSPKGEVVIAAGNTVELVNAQTPDLRVEYTAPGNQAINAGQVIASSGSVGIYGTLIKNSGVVSASAATIGDGGKIVLKAVKDVTLDATSSIQASGAAGGSVTVQADTGTLLAQGTIEAKGSEAKGGEIQLLGTQVGLIGTTNVDASGDQGGGTVLVGGNFHGGGPQQNASMVYVGSDVSLKADAVTSGDGGGIAVWSDNGTRFFGTNSARGGLVSGNGGLVEVSGRDYLLYRGRTDTRAHNGLDGLLLLDPDDVTISNSATSADITDATGLFARNDTTNAGANVYWGDIDRDLATTSVQIKTSNGGTLSASASGNLGTGAYQATTATDNHDLWLNSSGALDIAAGISSAVKTGYEFTGTTINVSGVTIATNGGLVKFDNATTLTGNAVVNAGTGTISTGAITGGGNDLTLTGVATIGATSGVGALVANQSLTTTSTVSAGSVAVTGPSAINGGSVTTTGDQTYTGATTLGANTTLASTGSGTITLVGAITGGTHSLALNTGGTDKIQGGASGLTTLTTDATGTTEIQGTLTSTGAQTYNDAVTLKAATSIDTSAGGGNNVNFVGTLTGTTAGAENLTINAGAGGDVTFTGAVGGTRLGDISITNARNVTESAGVTAKSLTQVAGTNTGTTLLTGAVDTNSATGVSLTTAGAITQDNTINTTGGGVVSFDHGGLLTINGNITATGAVSESSTPATGTVTINLSRSIATSGNAVSFGRAVTLNGNGNTLTIDTTNAGGSAGGANVSFGSTLTGTNAAGENLTVNAGASGDVTFTGAVGGTRLGDISITNARNVTESAGVTAKSLTQVAGTNTGTTLLTGAVDTNSATGVSLTTAGAITQDNTINTTGTGGVTLANGGLLTINANTTSDGIYAQTGAGATTVTGTRSITTTGDAVSFATGVTLNGGTFTIDTTNAGGSVAGNNVTFSSTLTGTTADVENLTLKGGTGGNVTLTGAVGGTRLGDIAIQGANSVTETAGVTSKSLVLTAGHGATLLTGAVNTDGANGVSLTTAGTITQNNTITTTGTGGVTLANGGLLTINGGTTSDGTYAQTGAGATTVTGTRSITTTGDAVSFATGVTLNGGALSIDTTSGSAAGNNVTFASTLTGTSAGAENLTLSGGTTGDIAFNNTVGATRLGDVLVNNAHNVTAGAFTAKSLRQATGAGATTLNGAVNVTTGVPTTTSGVVIAANNIVTGASSTITTGGTDLFLAGDDIQLGGAASSINTGGGNAVLTTQTAGQSINLGSATAMGLTATEVNTITGAPTVQIGNSAALLSTAVHTGAINVVGGFNPTPAGLTLLKLDNGGDINLTGATLTSPTATTLNSANGNINFNAGGQISAAGQTVNLSAGNAVNGNTTDVNHFIAGAPTPNVVAQSLVATAVNGVGPTNALTTQLTNLSARTTGGNVQVDNVGATNISGGAGTYSIDNCSGLGNGVTCPSGTGGDMTLVSTGAITQSAPLRTDAITAVTVNSPGADITLSNTSNIANSYSIYACLGLPGGCPTSAGLSPAMGNGSNTGYGNGAILYRDANGANLTGIGTISSFTTFTNGPLTVAASNISASSITLEAAGNITINLGSPLTSINAAGTGSFNLTSGGNIVYSQNTGTFGTAGSPFTSDLNLKAAGGITLQNSLYQGARNLTLVANSPVSMNGGAANVAATGTGDVVLQGNYTTQTGGNLTVTGRDFNVTGGGLGGNNQILAGEQVTVGGTLNIMNSGVIRIDAGSAASGVSNSGALLNAQTVNIGTAGGGASNPKRLEVKGGTNNNVGVVVTTVTDPAALLPQTDAIIESSGSMNVYLSSDASTLDGFGRPTSLQITGGTATATDNGGAIRLVTALGALRSLTDMTMVADGSIVLQGGTTNLNATSAFAASSAILQASTTKDITTNNLGSIILAGGTVNVLNSLTSVSARNAVSIAQIDPSVLTMQVGGDLVLIGGTSNGPTGSLTSARIDAGSLINISVLGPSAPFSYQNTQGGGRVVNGSLIMIGADGTGFFDANNIRLTGPGGYPQQQPITITLASGVYTLDLDPGRGDSVVQTGLVTFDQSLLSYIIFAANEETRSARIVRGLSTEDVGSPACK